MKSAAVLAVIACHVEAPRPPARATIDPAAIATLDAWAKAVGGRDAVASLPTIHLRGKLVRGGIAGTYEAWQTASGARYEIEQLGFLREVRVFDGARGWLVDRNGWVRELAGVELDDELAIAFVMTNAALLPERLPGRVARTADNTLVLTPAGGHRAVTMAFDPTTHLPRGFTRPWGDKLRMTELSDWRRVGDARFPFAIVERDSDPNDTTTLAIAAIDTTDAPAIARPPDRETDVEMTGDVVELPLDLLQGSLIMAHARVGDHPLDLIVDSGAESSVLNVAHVSELGLSASGAFAVGAGGGDTVASYVPHVTFELGGARVRDQIVAAIDFTLLEQLFGHRIDGILGYDFLSRFVVEIDYGRARMRLYDRARYHHDGGEPIAITLEGSTPWVDASIDVPGRRPVTGHFTVDTGCGCEVSLTTPFTDDNHLLDAFSALPQGRSAGAGGETRSLSGEIPALHVGGETIVRPIADFSRDATGATADPESAGLIGAQIFRRYRLVLDYTGGRMWLDPPTGS